MGIAVRDAGGGGGVFSLIWRLGTVEWWWMGCELSG
jgi:hypothetical protein